MVIRQEEGNQSSDEIGSIDKYHLGTNKWD